MIKKICAHILLLLSVFLAINTCVFAADYKATYSREQKEAICKQLQMSTPNRPQISALNNNIIPDSVFMNIYNTTKSINNSVSVLSVLGDVLMCHASHAAKEEFVVATIKLFNYPNFSIWFCGLIVYFFGFMLILSITFYVVDIAFKLGLAVILLPIGIALWPFRATHDRLKKLISIILHSAAIFVFLALTVSYTLNMLDVAMGNLDQVFEAIDTNNTDTVENTFTLFSSSFLIVLTALVYGMKLIGSTIPDYVDKFFPDNVIGGNVPMHHVAVQAMDFANKKAVMPAAHLAYDITKTQTGRLTEGVGNVLTGKYHQNIMTAIRNPRQTIQKAQLSVSHKGAGIAAGAMKGFNNLKYGARIAGASLMLGGEHQDVNEIRRQIREERDSRNEYIDNTLQENYDRARGEIDSRIEEREQARLDRRQQRHQERMANSSFYRWRYQREQQRQQRRQNRRNERDARIGQLDQQIANSGFFGRIVPKTKRFFYKTSKTVDDGLRNIWKAPGEVLKNVGQTMQDNRPSDKK